MSIYDSYVAWENEQEAIITDAVHRETIEILEKLQIGYSVQDLLETIEENAMNIFLKKCAKCITLKQQKQFHQLLQDHYFNYNLSIRAAIYTLLQKEVDRISGEPEPYQYPGILEIQNEEDFYIISTILGTVRVNKASSFFKNTNCSSIFYRQLMSNCHARSFDFLQRMPRYYKAVILSSPHYFDGKFYHTYVESPNHVVDMAGNAYYPDKEEAKITLQGEIVAKLSYDEVLEEYSKIPKEYSFLTNSYGHDKIYRLAMYYGHQRSLQHLNTGE